MKLFVLSLMLCIGIFGGSCHANERGGVIVKTFSIAHTNTISVFTYGVDSNGINYFVLEVGQKNLKTQIDGKLMLQSDGNLKGIQYLDLEGMGVRLTSSHRMFIVDRQKCITSPLTFSLKFVEQSLENRAQEFSDELQAGLNRNEVGEKQ
jgi:hypothetical protein